MRARLPIASIGSGGSMGWCRDSYASTRVTRTSGLSAAGVLGGAPQRRSISRKARVVALISDRVDVRVHRLLYNFLTSIWS
jgi:hypothetical protein